MGKPIRGGGTRERASDAQLIALANELVALDAETDRLSVLNDDLPQAEYETFMRESVYPLVGRSRDLWVRLARMPAATTAGLQAKARAVLECTHYSPGYVDAGDDHALAWSLANDVLGQPSVWREEIGESEVRRG